MRIMIVVHEFPCDGNSFHGGIATYYRNLSQVLKKNGNDVTVITLSRKYDDSTIWNDIEVSRVKIPDNVFGLARIIGTKTIESLACAFFSRRRIDKIAERFKPDIIQYANFKGMSFFRPGRIPCVVRMSSDNTLWREAYKEHYNYHSAYKRMISEDRFELKAVKRADAIFAPSRLLAGITEKRTGREVEIIESLYSPVKENDSVFARIDIKDKRFMLFFGAICPMKGCLAIGDVLTPFFDCYPDMHFVFIGRNYHIYDNNGKKSVSTREYIEHKNLEYSGNMIFLDNIEREFIVPFVKKAEACVFPSRIDNLPNTCLEAMYEKKVVIGTRGASFEQLIDNGRSGFLVEIDDRKELFDAMLRVMKMTDDEKTAMGEAAFERLSEYSEQKIYKQMMVYYENIINKRRELMKK